jgi:hypothetical protein
VEILEKGQIVRARVWVLEVQATFVAQTAEQRCKLRRLRGRKTRDYGVNRELQSYPPPDSGRKRTNRGDDLTGRRGISKAERGNGRSPPINHRS